MSLKNARRMTKSLTMRADSLLNLRDGHHNISARYSDKSVKVSNKTKEKLLKISKDMFTIAFENIIEEIEKEQKK